MRVGGVGDLVRYVTRCEAEYSGLELFLNMICVGLYVPRFVISSRGKQVMQLVEVVPFVETLPLRGGKVNKNFAPGAVKRLNQVGDQQSGCSKYGRKRLKRGPHCVLRRSRLV